MRERQVPAAFAADMPFVLVSSAETIVGRGCLGRVPSAGPMAGQGTLGEQVNAYFAAHPAGPRLLVGALPYDKAAPAHLYQPAELSRSPDRACFAAAFPPPALVAARPPAPHWQVSAEPSLTAYREAVTRALQAMAASDGALRKVVLSRSLRLAADRPIDASALLRALSMDERVSAFCVPLAGDPAPRALIGATPELLVARQGDVVTSHPLAGSARRARDARADEAAATALFGSEKDQREHREVVTAILDQLAPHCVELGAPKGTEITATASMWHLGTRIVGRLRRPETSVADLAELLHPTPAVCGTPRAAAARVIDELEGYDRGFYAGAVGWVDAAGDGAWHVAIRCAEVAGRHARLYAGAGIVPGSDPAAEGEETSAKFAALLHALGIDETGRSPAEDVA